MRYASLVKVICGEGWESTVEEIQGGYAVAMMYSYIFDGCPADVSVLARHVGISLVDAIPVYKRMLSYGLFTHKYRNDPTLLNEIESPKTIMTAWCYVAGIGSGFI